MPTPGFTPVNSEGQVSAGELRRMSRYIQTQERPVRFNGVGDFSQSFQNQTGHFDGAAPDLTSWIEITASDSSGAYSWKLKRDEVSGNSFSFVDHEIPGSGDPNFFPAYEKSGKTDVAIGSNHRAWRGSGQYFIFDDSGAGGGGASLTNTQCRGGSVTLGPNETKFVPFTPATGVGSQPYFQGDPGIFKKSSGNFDHGYYHLSGSCFIESSDCLSVYHCAWYGDTQATWPGVAVAGAPNGGKIQIVSSTHILINAFLTTSFFKFGVFHTGTDTVQVSGGNFGITKLGAE